MKVLFVYTNIEKSTQEHLGIAYLSGMLKHHDIETYLWDNTFETKEDLKKKVEDINPDFVCFSALSVDYDYAIELGKLVKSTKDVPIIIGGPHVTFVPQEALTEDCFDVVIRGEGEETLLEYVQTKNPKTEGTWVKENGVIHTNPIRDLPDLDKLPWPDHNMFEKHFKKKVTWSETEDANYGIFITSRGCPFRCAYCSNSAYQDLYWKKKPMKYTRFRDIDNVIEEVKHFVKKNDIKFLYFQDETLTVDKKRVLELCKKYKEEINLPWHAETRADTVDKEVLQAMADAGCELLMMGIESGSERVRNEILKRGMKREDIINAFKWAKEVGIKTSGFNICGSPTETKEEIMQTIALNKECGADVGKITIFTAFPGTGLWDYCNKNGYYIRKRFPTNYYVDSNIKHDILTLDELKEMRKKFVDAMGGYSGSTKKGEI